MANIVWTGAGGDDNFNNPANWSPAQVPGAGDNVTIDTTAATTINLTTDFVGSLAINKFVTLSLANDGCLTIGNGSTATTFSNAGTLELNSTGSGTDFIIDAPTVSLTGAGTILLSNAPENSIQASVSGDVLDNVSNHIVGAGGIGSGNLAFVNGASGVVNADDTSSLVINTGTATTTNSGLLEATSTGGLVLQSVVNDGASGKISAVGGGVYLDGADIIGGTLTASSGGTIYQENTSGDNGSTLDGTAHQVVVQGPLVVDNDCGLGLLGTIDNLGTISLASGGSFTDLFVGTTTGTIASTVTLTGAGTVVLSDNNGNEIAGAIAGDTLVNVNNTIEGAGGLNGNLVLVNESAGIIDATGMNALYLNSGGNAITNSGLLEAKGAGGLVIQSVVNDGASGKITAAGGNVYLDGTDILGGTLTASSGGTIYQENTAGLNGSTLDGTANTVVLNGLLVVDNDCGLGLLGTIDNLGTISLVSGGSTTNLDIGAASGTIASTVTLTGAGVIALSDSDSNYIFGAIEGDTLVNVNNTIEGAGQLNGNLVLINDSAGIIDATGTNGLILNSGGNTITNSGLIEATGTGGLTLESVLNNGAAGTIAAAGGNVYFNNGDVMGGTLAASAGGTFFQENSSGNYAATLDGTAHEIVLNAPLVVDNDCGLQLLGTIANNGTITLNSGGSETDLTIGVSSGSTPSTVTLTGSGAISLTNNESNYFFAGINGDTLLNDGNTITGAGTITSGLVLVNAGIVEASDSNPLYIASSTLTNALAGQLLAANGGNLVLDGGAVTNDGLIQANDGSTVTSGNNTTLTNDSSKGTLSGGTYTAISATGSATLAFNGAAVTTLSADVVLSGTGSEISFGGVAIETDLAMISKTGELQVLAGRAYTSKKIITNYGTVALGGGSFKPYGFNSAPGSVVSGFGTIASKFNDNGTLTAVGGTLDLASTDTVNGAVTGTGTLAIGGATTLGTKTTLSVSNIALLSKATLDLGTSVSFAGTFNVTGAATLDGTGTFTNTGLFESTGKGVGTISAAVANSGTISVASGSSLAFSGGLANSGLILDSGTFTDTAALTGGSLTLGGTSSHATIATATGTGNSTLATLTSAGGDLNTSGTTITVTGDYDNTAAGTGNSYDPFKGVTGTIDANGTQLAVVGVDGTTISSVNGTLTIAIAAHGKASFVIENAGPAGDTLLRGALQTSVNGGSITSKSLSGSGVKAGNYGPLAGGSESGTYTIAYNGSAPLTGQAIHIASDFANVAGVTIDIVAQGAAPTQQTLGALPDATPSASDMLVVPKG